MEIIIKGIEDVELEQKVCEIIKRTRTFYYDGVCIRAEIIFYISDTFTHGNLEEFLHEATYMKFRHKQDGVKVRYFAEFQPENVRF